MAVASREPAQCNESAVTMLVLKVRGISPAPNLTAPREAR